MSDRTGETMKRGTRVWIGPSTYDGPGVNGHPVVFGNHLGAVAIPDSPHLANVARLLAAEPGIAAAVNQGIEEIECSITDWSTDSEGVVQLRTISNLLRKLAAALGGES